MFGMSDDEEGFISEEEADSQGEDDLLLGRNVVASAIHEGGGGGAFASPATSKVLSSLEGLAAPSSSFVGQGQVDLFAAEEQRPSPSLLTSPLIAGLNPFAANLPSLDLPPAAVSPGSVGGGWGLGGGGGGSCGPGGGDWAVPGEAHPSDASLEQPPPPACSSSAGVPGGLGEEGGGEGPTSSVCGAPEVAPDVQHLLVEMGDLLCQLQKREELAITAEEAVAEDMLAKLEHFREVAQSPNLARRS